MNARNDHSIGKVGSCADGHVFCVNTLLVNGYHNVWYVDDMAKAEKLAHLYMNAHRINDRREYFYLITPSDSHRYEAPLVDMTMQMTSYKVMQRALKASGWIMESHLAKLMRIVVLDGKRWPQF